MPSTSVRRSARTMGAVRATATSCVCCKTTRFEHLAHLARGDREDEPREEGEQAIELGHPPDAEPRQVVFPLEKPREVIAEGERAREPKGRPREPPQALADLV